MHRTTTTLIAAAVFAVAAVATSTPARADVQVGVHIGVPPPVVAFPAPPRLVVVPGVPHVHYAPDVSVNFFSYGGRYYTYDDGRWYRASRYDGPWAYVEHRHVPAPLLRVPPRYYRVPPRLVGGGHWHDGDRHDRKHWKKHKKHDKHGKKHGKRGKHGRRHRH